MQNLDLIDWGLVGFSSLWIGGLALILSALGMADYHAAVSHVTMRQVLAEAGYRVAIDLGMTFFCVGMLGMAVAWWERVLWGLLAVAFLAYALGAAGVLKRRRG
ncbi:MAG: hypothetical protein NTU91_12365 [Chloroflexi bacterium]|nr:hypothetical protein [Chloroflexota bacterium]